MRCLVALLVLAALGSATPLYTLDMFRQWAARHGKIYTGSQELYRFQVFQDNMRTIAQLNSNRQNGSSAVFAPNMFADLDPEEFAALHSSGLALAPSRARNSALQVVADNEADELDMRSWLPPVKNQKFCGSCWAFSAVANMEGQIYRTTGRVVSLSEQQLISCDRNNNACKGGLMTTADQWVLRNGGIASEASYPYVSASGNYVPACKRNVRIAARFRNAVNLGEVPSDEDLISYLKQYGPLSVAVAAEEAVFKFYESGVVNDAQACGLKLNHGVTLVGYGTDAETGTPYWTIRNSWGPSWGEEGYIRLARGQNMCGINSVISTIVA